MDLGSVDRITADAVGEPGARVFYLQARGTEFVTVIVEKQQVQLLAASVLELLATLDLETGTGPDDDAMALEEPFEPRWRAGRLSLGFEQDRDLFLLEIEEFVPELEEDDPRAAEFSEPEEIRAWATREQMFALSRYGTAVAERGRPLCQFCGNPMSPEGHACPAMNGHSKRE
jgi:uncharacterized repeat protein (TIGR03847 family)